MDINHSKLQPRLSRYIPGFIRRDFWRKLLALAFALLLYFSISSRLGTEERIPNVPVQLDLPSELVNMDKFSPLVTVTVRGSKRALAETGASSLKIRVPIARDDLSGGPRVIRLSPKDVVAPFGIGVLAVEPRDLVLNLEPIEARKLSVEARFDSLENLKSDYDVGKITLKPAEVWVHGPRTLVSGLSRIYTKPIPLDESIMESFEYNIELQTPEEVKLLPGKVLAGVEIVKRYSERVFAAQPLRLLMPVTPGDKPVNVELLEAASVEVTINGPKGVVYALKPGDLTPYLDLQNLTEPGSYTADVRCNLNNGDGCRVLSISPSKIPLKITAAK